jgi:UPF0716 family protein affecting phage T7 exclusion
VFLLAGWLDVLPGFLAFWACLFALLADISGRVAICSVCLLVSGWLVLLPGLLNDLLALPDLLAVWLAGLLSWLLGWKYGLAGMPGVLG